MFLFWRDLLIGLIAWSCTVYAEKKLATAMFIQPHNYSDWIMLLMFEPVSLLISSSLIVISIYAMYQLSRRHGYLLMARRVFWGIERGVHFIFFLYGAFLLWIEWNKFPWATGIVLSLLFIFELVQFFPWKTRDS